MFDIGSGEFIGLVLLGLMLFGPERLPGIASDVARMIRQVRSFASSATSELKEGLGPELTSLADVRPSQIRDEVTKAFLEPEPSNSTPRIDPDAT